MAFLTVKTVKGRQYLYVQWSWREGGKVKTDALYIAPVDGSTGEIQMPETKTIQEVYAETRKAFLNGGNALPEQHKSRLQKKPPPPKKLPPIPDKVELVKKPKPTPKNIAFRPLSLHVKINYSRLGISKNGLEQRHRKHEQILNAAKLDPDIAPKILMRHGLTHRVREFSKRGIIGVSVGRFGKGTANRARESLGRALALAKLSALQVQNPSAYMALSLHGETTQKETKTALRKFLYATNGRGRLAKAIAVKMFGTIEPIRMGRTKRLPASHLGLSDYGNRSNWREDATLLLMEIEKHKGGYSGVLSETKTELRKATATKRNAENQGFSATKLVTGKRMSWGRKRKKEIRRAEARMELQQIRLERLNSLREVFWL